MFNVSSCIDAANSRRVDDWVRAYLGAGPWANAGLREGLQHRRRYWIGPLLLPLQRLERCCGPESGMEFSVPAVAWHRKVSEIAAGLTASSDLPPLIVEWRDGLLSIRDGNHRYAAMAAAGWSTCWVIIWCNTADDHARARTALDIDSLVINETRFEHLRRNGWALFSAAVPNNLVSTATTAIAADRTQNYDAERQREYDNISYCPDLRGEPPISELLTHSRAKMILDRALGWSEIAHDRGQIAIRQAHNTDRHYPPEPHIDGIGTGINGLAPGSPISNFTALVGVFLTRVDTEFAGNFTVWPGSHRRLEAHFRVRGPQAMHEGMPQIELGQPVQLFADPGDVVLCHYQLAHAAAVNLSANDRIAIYFRVWLKDIESRRWELLTNIWDGWRV
jgi:Phytanoyl-CoA dioxygenase (PhyH)